MGKAFACNNKSRGRHMVKVFLDIDIGDPVEHDKLTTAYTVSQEFCTRKGAQVGLPGGCNLSDPSAEDKDLLQDAFVADPQWLSKGSFRADPPPALRAGRLVVDLLYEREAPRAIANFKALCTGEKGLDKASKKPLHYQGSCFHRIVKGFVCQGGDITRGDGSGGASIYGGKFNDEKAALKIKHGAAGVVGFANSGKNSNSSQFYVTLAAAPQCDGKHVVVGTVADGHGILYRIEAEAASADGTPRVEVRIADCGILPT